ncbi:MAG: rhomboid family intramembrane serine protease [Anaerolineae bacterium]|nr:rhomboid family intramembrane serine protease [Anaerolineae bacterium]
MLPIRDTIRARNFPIVTWLLIAANAVVFFFELTLSPAGLEQFIANFGVVPANLSLSNPLSWFPLLSHMFLHGGWMHVLSNMWTLVIFGDNVEDRMGPVGFLLFYLLGGVVAGLIQAFSAPGSAVPAIGASGAIAAVLGAYFLFFPKSRVITLIPLFFLPWFVEIPALVYLGVWFVSQLFSGALALATASGVASGGVAWWAHVGGFVFGLLVCNLFVARRPKEVWHRDEYYPF